MWNSVKQLARTPLKVFIFLVLLAASAALLIIGTSMWVQSSKRLENTKEVFTTIGTVTQKETQVAIYDQWDAALGEYTHWTYPVYDTIFPVSILQFEGAEYVKGPEKRPYYAALVEGCERTPVSAVQSNLYVFVEFTPIEDCIPDHPVEVKIERVLWGDVHGSETLWFCDHFTENPAPLEEGKTYIAGLQYQANTHSDVQIRSGLEFTPWIWPESTQTDKDGARLESDMNMPDGVRWEEVTDGFYETTRGKGWLSLMERQDLCYSLFPVLPTEGCSLLPSFHSRDASVVEGREISDEEFQSGALVCMVPDDFARYNGLELGDSLSLSLIFANYKTSPGYTFGYNYSALDFSFANSEGDMYQAFWDAEYEIVGIYRYSYQNTTTATISDIGRDTVIIPSKSVQASDEQNIADYGPMISSTTSFQIPNGSISAYDKAFQESGLNQFFEISYDDNGYEQVAESLRQTENVAFLLCLAGLFSVITVVLLLLYFFVVKQKKRTAIERSLGMSRRQCRVSILSGIMLMTVVAVVLGSAAGLFAKQKMEVVNKDSESIYSTEFSSWVKEEADTEFVSELSTEDSSVPLAVVLSITLCLFTFVLSMLTINHNLKIEPIQLLSQRDE